jgi:hypothetical protein
MKMTVKLMSIFAILLYMACPVLAKGTAGVANTIHNLSSTNTTFSQYASDNVDEVCVFCHTPHGGLLTGPLWNHSLPSAASFTHYNSATLSSYLKGLSVSRNINDESLLCMACHDGSVAVDHLINDPNSLNGAPITIFFGNTDVEIVDVFGVASRIGASPSNTSGKGDLSDDHPISFSYSDVLDDPVYAVGGSKDGQLRPVGDTETPTSALGWNGEGVRFFGADNRVECSSCHDPHVNYEAFAGGNEDYRPFLIRPNSGSGLCLACHNK